MPAVTFHTMSDAEVMTTALVASLWYGGNHETARTMLHDPKYIPQMLSKSRFNRRWHRLAPQFLMLFEVLGEHFKALNADSIYVIDTFPIASIDNYRIPRSKRHRGEAYRGRIASKKRYYFGLKLHLLVTRHGQPVEFVLTPAAVADMKGLRLLDFDLPPDAIIYADKGYTDYLMEDLFADADLHLSVMRKRNSKRPVGQAVAFLQHHHRKIVETTGSSLQRLLPKSIHAVTARGFELKLASFLLALSFNAL